MQIQSERENDEQMHCRCHKIYSHDNDDSGEHSE